VEISALGETKKHFFTLYRVADGNALNWGVWGGADLRVRIENLPEGFGVNPAVWADDPGRAFGSEFKWFLRGSLDSEGFYAAMLAGLSELPEEVLTGQSPLRPTQTTGERHKQFVARLKLAVGDEPGYPHYLAVPSTYNADPDRRWPLIVYLHGAGGVGADPINRRVEWDQPYVLVMPQCPAGEWGWSPSAVVAMVDRLVATMRVDPDRVYLTGVSMGGFGTWTTAASYPDRFAAIAPVCGGMDANQAVWLKDMPIWAFHGELDNIVPVDFTRGPVNRLREVGAPHLKYTELPGEGHDINHVYSGGVLFDWLLQQRRPAKP
jgi:predicted esterase